MTIGKALQKEYHEANKETLNEYSRAYYAANSEEILEKQNAYRVANRETIREKQREKVPCSNCGAVVSHCNMPRHKKTKRCQNSPQSTHSHHTNL